jgi:hypothetical protein
VDEFRWDNLLITVDHDGLLVMERGLNNSDGLMQLVKRWPTLRPGRGDLPPGVGGAGKKLRSHHLLYGPVGGMLCSVIIVTSETQPM